MVFFECILLQHHAFKSLWKRQVIMGTKQHPEFQQVCNLISAVPQTYLVLSRLFKAKC